MSVLAVLASGFIGLDSAIAATVVPPRCPASSLIASQLHVTVSKLTFSRGPTSLLCQYSTSAGNYLGKLVIPTQLRYTARISNKAFAAEKAYNHGLGVAYTDVVGVGTSAYVTLGVTPWLYVHQGSLELVIIAPKATRPSLISLGRALLH